MEIHTLGTLKHGARITLCLFFHWLRLLYFYWLLVDSMKCYTTLFTIISLNSAKNDRNLNNKSLIILALIILILIDGASDYLWAVWNVAPLCSWLFTGFQQSILKFKQQELEICPWRLVVDCERNVKLICSWVPFSLNSAKYIKLENIRILKSVLGILFDCSFTNHFYFDKLCFLCTTLFVSLLRTYNGVY